MLGAYCTDGVARELGWVSQDMISRHAHAPAADTRALVCGLPAVYDAICGPRLVAGVAPGSYLAALGYSDEMVIKL